jgi:transposase InsO family protein
VSHANAALTPRARLRLARLVVEDGWPVARAAERYDVSWPTAARWAQRYRQAGPAGMADRSSRPHRSPARTPAPVVRRIVHLRWRMRLGLVEIGARLGVPASTVHAVLVRCRINRLSHVDRACGEPVRRYEHPHPGSLLHVDVKKLGNIPDGGGWRYLGRQQGKRNRAAMTSKPRNAHRNPKIGTAFVHTVIDDHSRVAYAEIHDDETAATAATATAVLRRAVAWFAARGVTVERVLTDNGSPYRSRLWTAACTELGIRPKRTRPYRPQTNRKIERFHRTLAAGWAFTRMFPSEPTRRKALPGWLHEYNHHQPHTAISRHPPISRLTNLPGQYT